ncbi:hypothetical protein FEM48_Zijuj02G0130300 [Ziziphus jujuba var. spinosa]|uniref:CCHC-type domain-containing protein n=1 Tax=Ziziphus jujuba var. spinosa TaxID=714518 RepID=A0A978VVW0_ZIZJJ|nr:hypothetical protein FEM48_Zijuj02G0130300 [Ziziphus jujuba var. spinosa]
MNKSNTVKIGSLFKEVVSCEDTSRKNGLGMSFMRIQAEVDVTKPLPTSFFQKFVGKTTWIQFCYEKLRDLCYNCGIIGHLKNSCKLVDNPSARTDGDKFGVWLRGEDGAFSIMRKGSQLHRIENLRKDFFDSYSNEELRIDKEDQAIDPSRIPSSDLNHNSSPTRDSVDFLILNSGELPQGSRDQSEDRYCSRD